MIKKLIILIIILAGAGAAAWYFYYNKNTGEIKYKTAPVESGSIESRVSATGTLNAVVTVQIGSQVSGTIKELFADFNSKVRKGQIIAVLDQKTFIAQRDQVRANLQNAKANHEKAGADLLDRKQRLDRLQKLFNEGLASGSDRDSADAAYQAALAQVKSAEAQIEQHKAALELAEVNLEYTVIKSPVDGVVISRNVDIGQTVAASFQTPTLFTIAKDLTEMQVNTNVDEADIGMARVGQEAVFTVDAYPEIVFKGKVSQIRNAPQIIQNVVTYDVIIEVANKTLQLKPGMTANVSIITSRKDNVLKIPNAALRFKPSGEASITQSKHEKGPKVWILTDGQNIKPVIVKTGISDGSFTEVVEGGLQEGDAAVIEGSGRKNGTNKGGMSGAHRFLR